MPSAFINKLPGSPKWFGTYESAVGDLVGGGAGGLGRGVNKLKGLRAPKFAFRNPFAGAPKSVPKPGGVRPNPAQAGDDIVTAVNDIRPTTPLAGRPPNRLTTNQFLARTAVYGGGGYVAYRAVTSPTYQAADPLAPVNNSLRGTGGALGDATSDAFSGLGQGLAGLFSGTGEGVGAGVYNTLAGVGEGVKKVALPLALAGLGFLAFTALKK